jgi:hypothetical protein
MTPHLCFLAVRDLSDWLLSFAARDLQDGNSVSIDRGHCAKQLILVYASLGSATPLLLCRRLLM